MAQNLSALRKLGPEMAIALWLSGMLGRKQATALDNIFWHTNKKKKKNVKIELQWRNKNAFGSIQKCLVSFHVEIEKTQGLAASEENVEKGKKNSSGNI